MPETPPAKKNKRAGNRVSRVKKTPAVPATKPKAQSPADRQRQRPAYAYDTSDGSRAGYPTIDEQFANSYEEAGLSSSDNRVRQVRKQKKRAFGTTMQATGRNMRRAGRGRWAEKLTDTAGQYLHNKGRDISRANQPPLINQVRSEIEQKKRALETAAFRKVATRVNSSTYMWALPLWGTVQLPLAMLHLLFLVLAVVEGAIIQTFEEAVEVQADDGTIATVTKTVFKFLGETIEAVFSGAAGFIADQYGVDLGGFLDTFSAIGLFGLFQGIMFAYALGMVLAIGIIYKLAQLRPFSGVGVTAKYCAVLVMVVGYSFPLLNFLPWFVAWTAAVWVQPR